MSDLVKWAHAYVLSDTLAEKLDPPEPPRVPHAPSAAGSFGLARPRTPGRPKELRIVARAKSPRGSLVDPKKRAHVLHTFVHHELQAAELMALALVAFPETPRAFQVGLLRVFFDEIRHMQAYVGRLQALGYGVGDFPVRDWFWERLGDVPSPSAFVAAMGVGFEGGNLDHTARFGALFEAAHDPVSAAVVRRVGEEEIMHVRFGLTWLGRFLGKAVVGFDDLVKTLPPPLTPSVMRGPMLDRASRKRAGYTDEFLDAFDAFVVAHPSGVRSPARAPVSSVEKATSPDPSPAERT
jgi:uncharacterized ferritin-like protein (DUF455 family)